ncbi:hypothetical protein [Catalinimonas niigatensis]|uniref:hypothetical protein n=1 Tax=Catalinimonas niigatensis TaxID=1397264 RepID=UPI002665D014|nr:hypothetical protein [Catalinimonas niigatensis]WPP49539.1 hypothetical protein PZB72_22975 [Catalinimonas niigatensis]
MSTPLFAQNTVRVETGDFTYNQGDNILNLGLGLGATGGWGYGSLGFGVSLLGSYEFGFHRYISVGPYVGFANYNYDYFGYSNSSVTSLAIGAKGSLHVIPFIAEVFDASWNPEKVDLYVAVYTGVRIRNNRYDVGNSDFNDSDVDLSFGTVPGIRYMPKENIGIFGELGYGPLSVFTVGVTFEL